MIQKKGYGFLVPNDGSGDIFVHQSEVRSSTFASLCEGDEVEYKVKVEKSEDGKETRKAKDVTGPGGGPIQSSSQGLIPTPYGYPGYNPMQALLSPQGFSQHINLSSGSGSGLIPSLDHGYSSPLIPNPQFEYGGAYASVKRPDQRPRPTPYGYPNQPTQQVRPQNRTGSTNNPYLANYPMSSNTL